MTMNTIEDNRIFLRIFFILLVISLFTAIPEILFASSSSGSGGGSNTDAITTVVCNVVKQLTGPIGQAVSTIAVIFIGIGLFMGKISWGLALGIAIGMAMLFGAENIVGWVSGDTTFKCTTGNVIH